MKKIISIILLVFLLNINLAFAVTNISNLTKANITFYDMVYYSNEVTNDIMGMGFIIVIFFILLSIFNKRYGTEDIGKSLLASSFLCLMLSIGLVAIKLLNFYFILVFAVTMVLTGFYVWLSKK